MVICVTGPMAAGKNAASALLEQKGFAAIDADLIGHKAVEQCRDQILAEFSNLAAQKGILLANPDGSVNRRALGQLIFNSTELIAKQEAIVFPKINQMLTEFMDDCAKNGKNCAINATVLYKLPLCSKMNAILYVDCPKFIRLNRALKRDHLPKSQIRARFKSQKNLFAKYKNSNADTVRVWNTLGLKFLDSQINRFLARVHLRGY